MTQYDSEKYAEAVKKYEYRKHHLYIFGHDDRTLISFMKKGILPAKWYLIILIAFVAFCAVMGGFFALIADTPFVSAFLGWALFFLVTFVISSIYNYFLYLNYVEADGDDFAIEFFSALGILFISEKVHSESLALAIILDIAIFLGTVALLKSINYEKQNEKPQAKEFDSERDLEEEKRQFAKVKQRMREEEGNGNSKNNRVGNIGPGDTPSQKM